MNDFKLLAIRPLIGTSRYYLKNLIPGRLYNFYSDYTFNYDSENDLEGTITSITNKPSIPHELYKTKVVNNYINVNISSLVGKNGSGKSSLFELFYLATYCIATKKSILPGNEKNYQELLNKFQELEPKPDAESDEAKKNEAIKKALSDLTTLYENFKLEIYFQENTNIYRIRFDSDVTTDRFEKTNDNIFWLVNRNSEFNLNKFFYTISINYSIYSLNSDVIGEWINDLFHKNDGYQTPIVINPFRDNGEIQINNEFHLANTRLLTNLIDDDLAIKEVFKNKIADKVVFHFDSKKKERMLYGYNLSEAINRFLRKESKSKEDAFREIYDKIINNSNSNENLALNQRVFYNEIVDYVVGKVIKIAHQYPKYHKFRDFDDIRFGTEAKVSLFPSLRDYASYLNELSQDKSHVTLKLRQILNTLRFDLLREEDQHKWKDNSLELEINELKNRITPYTSKRREIIELIPGAFFKPELLVRTNIDGSENSVLERMSSGELQFVHTLQSIFYHLIFVNSVHRSNENNLIKYEYINLFFDEVELYFHPELQRIFISELLDGLSRLNLNYIKGINMIFSTHSPFILSDIPVANVLKLKEGLPFKSDESQQTFGANIHEMLANEFFMENGVIGEVAKEKISRTLNWLKIKGNNYKKENGGERQNFFEVDDSITYSPSENEPNYHKQIIEMIGEPVIKFQLKKMYMEFVNDNDYLTEEIEKIRKLYK